jgi:hypothetical protein
LRLQQLPQPSHRTPSWVQLPAPVVCTSWHTPSVAPVALLHQPPQQSVSREQASPGWMQKDAPSTHLLLVHKPEQQREDDPPSAPPSAPGAPPALQGLPAVRQAVLSGAHLPALQFWPQHSPEVAQVWLSATQGPILTVFLEGELVPWTLGPSLFRGVEAERVRDLYAPLTAGRGQFEAVHGFAYALQQQWIGAFAAGLVDLRFIHDAAQLLVADDAELDHDASRLELWIPRATERETLLDEGLDVLDGVADVFPVERRGLSLHSAVDRLGAAVPDGRSRALGLE